MASDGPTLTFTLVAGSTFSTGDLYKGVIVNSSGYVQLATEGTTDVESEIIGTLYSITSTTSSTGSQAVTVGWGPVLKVRMAASTAAAGNQVCFSTAALGVAPTTNDTNVFGRIIRGSSGAANRIHTVVRVHGAK